MKTTKSIPTKHHIWEVKLFPAIRREDNSVCFEITVSTETFNIICAIQKARKFIYSKSKKAEITAANYKGESII